jgi:opacity protein-like surface antigen
VSSSSAFTFHFNGELEVWQRSERTTGGIFLERAEPLGAGKADFSIGYAYVKYDEINGRDLSNELQTIDANGAVYTFHVRDAEAQLANFTLTYGATDTIDLSLVIPVERIYMVSNFTVLEKNGDLSVSDVDRRDYVGVGDIVLRGKWQALVADYANVATGLELKVPSGDPDKALGLGDTRLTPWLYASQIFRRRIEPHLQAGFEINLADARKSRFAWGAGLDFALISSPHSVVQNVGVVAEVIGRTDLEGPTHVNPDSFFGPARQRNIMDVAAGFKIASRMKS